MKILVDILGGDTAPKNMVEGAVLAMREDAGITCALVGDENYARPIIEKAGLADRVEYIHTTENIAFDEQPTQAIRRPGTSMMIGLEKLKLSGDGSSVGGSGGGVGSDVDGADDAAQDEYKGFVSAGSTGALLAGAFFKIGRIDGISRPTLCPWIPTKRDDVKMVLADAGANMDCSPINLVHFAIMTEAYMRLALGVKNPRVALVNVGTEDSKGNELTHKTFPILRALADRGVFNFVGNMEARDAVSGDYDVLICDGFVGNVVLKCIEGAMSVMGHKVNEICHASLKCKIGGLLLRKRLKKFKSTFHEDATGGSPLLGIKKPVIKAHGNSSARAFKNAILCAATSARCDVSGAIRETIEKHKDLIAEMTAEKK